MPLYESVFIVRQDVTATQVDSLTDGFAKVVEENGGSIDRREYWGLRNLTYRIKKNRKGHYVLFNMEAPPDCVQEMERTMRLNEDVLRYMTVRVDEARSEPSPIMQGKGDRERERADRGRSGGGRGDRGDRGDRVDRGRSDRADGPPAAAKPESPATESKSPATESKSPATESKSPATESESPATDAPAETPAPEASSDESPKKED